jgi:hypothetical protein
MLGEIMFVSRCEKSMRGIFRPSSEFLRDAVEGTQLVLASVCSWPIAAAALAGRALGAELSGARLATRIAGVSRLKGDAAFFF